MGTGPASITWIDDENFTIGDTHFSSAIFDRFTSTPDRFCLVKTRSLVERYVTLLADLAPQRIVELGIAKGGSTAMLAALLRPERLVAADIIPDRVEALDAFIEAQGLSGRVEAHYAVDQSDKAQLGGIVDAAFGDTPLDLVLDDASHHLDLTRASFDLLFPRLRPGGLYVIEDWAWAHVGWNVQRPGDAPLSLLVFEAILAVPQRPGLIDDIQIDEDWVAIRRGPLEVPRDGFELRRHASSRGLDLLREPEPGG